MENRTHGYRNAERPDDTLATPRRPRTNPNNNRKAFGIAMRAWADALVALGRAASACETLGSALGDLPSRETERLDGEDVRHDAWHTAWSVRSNLSLLEGSAPGDVLDLVRDAS